MIYEIFNCVNGETQGYRFGLDATKKTMSRLAGVYVHEKSKQTIVFDYMPARSGFYVLDMRNTVKFGPYATEREAKNKSDLENQSSDTNSFHVIEHMN